MQSPQPWQEMRVPEYRGPAKLAQLHSASRLAVERPPLRFLGETADQAVTLAPLRVTAESLEFRIDSNA